MYRKIFTRTVGIVFFATPHRGANLASTLRGIQTATFTGRLYVGDMAQGSQTVNRINNSFASHYRKFAFVSFWESTQTRLVGVGLLEI
jgi:hypothetical protein